MVMTYSLCTHLISHIVDNDATLSISQCEVEVKNFISMEVIFSRNFQLKAKILPFLQEHVKQSVMLVQVCVYVSVCVECTHMHNEYTCS